MIKEGEICVIWQSPEITNGPITTRNNLPQPMIDEVKAALLALPAAAPEVYKEMTGGETSTDKGYIEVNHERYQWILDMRAWIKANRKG
jgi:phosphonate transport system substrate-binding protein